MGSPWHLSLHGEGGSAATTSWQQPGERQVPSAVRKALEAEAFTLKQDKQEPPMTSEPSLQKRFLGSMTDMKAAPVHFMTALRT